jgi:LacI family transcriptional regulator
VARALRQQQTKTVGLVIPDILNRFYAAGASVLQATLEQHGYRLVICISNDDAESERSYLNALLQQRVDGIVHVPCTAAGARMVREAGNQVPVVELNRCSEGNVFDAVISDDREGALQLTRYLIKLGHRRIGVIAGAEPFSTTRARVSGVREAFREADLALDETLIRYRDYSHGWGEEAMREFIRSTPRPTAVFAAGNQLALGALQALATTELRVPDDISLIGFDDPEWFAAWRPGITTYALPLREMGLLAAQLLLARMSAASPTPTMPTITRLSGRLVIRKSCAAPIE